MFTSVSVPVCVVWYVRVVCRARNGWDLLDTTDHGVDVLDTTDHESRDAHSLGRTVSSLCEIRAAFQRCDYDPGIDRRGIRGGPLDDRRPCMGRHIDGWCDDNWATMESDCPWAGQYKFANMLEFGSLILLPDAVLGHNFLNHMRRAVGCISRHFSRLECQYVTSSPRTWGGSRKHELLAPARHCPFLEQYPLRCPGSSPQAVSYCCVQLIVSRSDFARVLCVATSNKSRKLVDAVVLVSRNEMAIEGSKLVATRGPVRVDGWPDLVIAGPVQNFSLHREVKEKVSAIRDYVDFMVCCSICNLVRRQYVFFQGRGGANRTSRKESRKDSTRPSSTATQGWSNHSRPKWFIDWCCGDASNPTAQPCGLVIFIDDSRRRRVLGAVLRWEDAKGGRRHFYMQNVYGAKGNVVANSKGTSLDLELCEGFGAGAVNTPFYRELVLGGGFVLAREFFDMLEDKNIALDVLCDVNPSLEPCSGCESSGAAVEGDDLGSGPATQLRRGESRGQFDDSEDEGTAPPLSDTRRSVLSIPGVQTDAPVQWKSTGPTVHVAAYSEVDLEASEGQGVEEVDAGGLGSQGAPQKRRGDRPDEFAGSTKKLKSKAPRTAGENCKGTEGDQGRQVAKRPSSRQKQPDSGPSSPPTTGTPIDVDVGYFLEYKDGVSTKREFDISPAQVVDLGDWEDMYNQRSLDPVLVEGIKEAMRLAFENKAQPYDLPTLKLVPLGLDKPTPGTKEERLRPEDWRDELAGQYYYYAVCGQHNAAAARSLLGSEVARKYNVERWPAGMVNFSDDDFEGYFLVSSQDDMKDLKAAPRQLKLSMRDIRWQWKRAGCPRAVMGNPSGKQDQVRKSAGRGGHQETRRCPAFPFPAGDGRGERLETGRLLGHDDAKWIMRKKKVKNVKPGVAYIHNDKLGRKEVVYNVPVDPSTKKGKKEKEEGEWFVQVPEPDAHCWKTMESLTDNEKCCVLKKVLACKVVWVQVGSPALAKLGKLSVQEVVNLVKCDRVLVRLWNYYQFKHDKRSDADWSQRFPFLKSRSAIFRQFKSRGLDAELWDGSTKYATDSSLFKDCPPYMGCDDDRSIEATEKLAGHKKLSVDWRNKVLSMLTGCRLKSREIALAEGIVHIKWNDTGDVTSIAPFGNDPLEADIRSAEVKEAVVATKSHTFVLDLCKPVDLKLWKSQAFDTRDSQLHAWCPSHWTLVVIVPRQQNLYFLASMNHLSFVKLLEGKWVRRSQQKKSFPVGNNLYTENDRMYILFKGFDLLANASVVYEGKLPASAAAAVRLLESVTKKGEGVVFLEKPHARSVWEILKAGRHVNAMEGNSELLQFTIDLVKSEGNSGAHNCEFMVVTETRARAWNNKTDMWFKLSARKRNKIYDFLFLQTRLKRDTDAEYVRRKDHMFTLLDNYHGVSRMNEKTFLERLQSLYFVESEEELTFSSYSSLISTEDEETTEIEFDATRDEEGSDTESLNLQYDQHSAADKEDGRAEMVTTGGGESSSQNRQWCGEGRDFAACGGSPTASVGARAYVWRDRRQGDGEVRRDPNFLRQGVWRARRQGDGEDRWDPNFFRRGVWRARQQGDDEVRRDPNILRQGQPTRDIGVGGRGCVRRAGSAFVGNRHGFGRSGCIACRGRRQGDGQREGSGGRRHRGGIGGGGEEREEEEDEGEEGEETELAGLLGGQEGKKGELDTGDDERTFDDDDDRSGESSDGFGQLYGKHQEEDDDDDDTTLGMETQVVTSLSAERDDYEVEAMTFAVDLQHRFNEARVAVSLTKPSVRIDIEEVIDGILGDHHMSAQLSLTPGVDDPLDVKPSRGSVADELSDAAADHRQRRRRRDRGTTRLRATTPGAAVTAIGSLRVLDDIERGLVPPDTVLSTLCDGQLRIAAKDILTLSLTDGRVNDDVVNFYMALLGTTAYRTSDIPPGLRWTSCLEEPRDEDTLPSRQEYLNPYDIIPHAFYPRAEEVVINDNDKEEDNDEETSEEGSHSEHNEGELSEVEEEEEGTGSEREALPEEATRTVTETEDPEAAQKREEIAARKRQLECASEDSLRIRDPEPPRPDDGGLAAATSSTTQRRRRRSPSSSSSTRPPVRPRTDAGDRPSSSDAVPPTS
ncbi:hypothetical protein CBR_g3217 [Chara braunii]|uniref:Uncharacterized protein n=1 Tax=Chara braunii TaxID=69332 RepID=A0A388KF94_CHABU|nr:hypothetical protein CBR_g3217 [Chara braunii]|eukprot:GBG68676.1 hypothetical protein CBR_g3217 [Chara braunii]